MAEQQITVNLSKSAEIDPDADETGTAGNIATGTGVAIEIKDVPAGPIERC